MVRTYGILKSSKRTLYNKEEKNMSVGNLYSVITNITTETIFCVSDFTSKDVYKGKFRDMPFKLKEATVLYITIYEENVEIVLENEY